MSNPALSLVKPMFPKLAFPKLEVQCRKGGSAAGRRSIMSIDGFTLPSPLKKNTGSFIPL